VYIKWFPNKDKVQTTQIGPSLKHSAELTCTLGHRFEIYFSYKASRE